MPPETPTPWSAKLTISALRKGLCRRARSVLEQTDDRRHRRGLVRPVRLDAHLAAGCAREQHHGDDVARARPPSAADQRDVAAETRSQLNDAGAGPRVQAV